MDFPPRPSLAVPVILITLYLIYAAIAQKKSHRPALPIVSARPGEWFPHLRAKWRNTIDFKTGITAAYSAYSKKDEACLLPLFGNDDFVLLPASNASFIIEQSEQVLSASKPHIEDLQTDRTLPDPSLVRNPTHHHVINRDLTSKVGNLVPDIIDEVERDLSEQWGTDTENWKEIVTYESVIKCIARTSNRVFIGAPLCRNQELLDAGVAFAQSVPLGSSLIRLFPKLLYPIVAPFILIPNKLATRTFFKHILPEVRNRLDEYDRRQNDPEEKSAEPPPNDYLQWTINHAKKSPLALESEPRIIGGRILMLNFAAIHTSTFSLTHALFDMAATDPANLTALRTEISSTLAANNNTWSKTALSQMTKLDSTLRESTRINSFVTVALARQVVSPAGVTTPQGLHLPQGTSVAIPGYPVHQDPDLWGPDAAQFRPFRFADQRDELLATTTTAADARDAHLKKARMAFPTTTNTFLAFGHGRLACPGRFFAANELKLMLAWIVANYDIERLETRPKNQWFGLIRTPDMKATIRVRRRVGTVG